MVEILGGPYERQAIKYERKSAQKTVQFKRKISLETKRAIVMLRYGNERGLGSPVRKIVDIAKGLNLPRQTV